MVRDREARHPYSTLSRCDHGHGHETRTIPVHRRADNFFVHREEQPILNVGFRGREMPSRDVISRYTKQATFLRPRRDGLYIGREERKQFEDVEACRKLCRFLPPEDDVPARNEPRHCLVNSCEEVQHVDLQRRDRQYVNYRKDVPTYRETCGDYGVCQADYAAHQRSEASETERQLAAPAQWLQYQDCHARYRDESPSDTTDCYYAKYQRQHHQYPVSPSTHQNSASSHNSSFSHRHFPRPVEQSSFRNVQRERRYAYDVRDYDGHDCTGRHPSYLGEDHARQHRYEERDRGHGPFRNEPSAYRWRGPRERACQPERQSTYQDRPAIYGSNCWEDCEEYRCDAYDRTAERRYPPETSRRDMQAWEMPGPYRIERTQNYAGYDAPRAYLEAEREHRYPEVEEERRTRLDTTSTAVLTSAPPKSHTTTSVGPTVIHAMMSRRHAIVIETGPCITKK